jgi:hypothetical protein
MLRRPIQTADQFIGNRASIVIGDHRRVSCEHDAPAKAGFP